jgi:signal transduction histidine kinase
MPRRGSTKAELSFRFLLPEWKLADVRGNMASMTTPAHEHAELLSLAVHEFRTPVTVVVGYTKMLVKEQLGPLSERQRKVLLDVEQQCGRLSRLLKELSDLAELVNPDTPPLARDEIAIAGLLDEATRGLEPGEDGAPPVARSGAPERMTVEGDRRLLPSALAAVIRAVVREQGGSARVAVDVARQQHDGRSFAAIAVGREGAPVAVHNGRPDGRFNEYPGGIGLGLPIARRVIEQAGGRVWSTEQERRLGVVTILLPLKESLS